MFLGINALSLQRLLIHQNKKKNKQGIVFKLSVSLSGFYNWCFDKVMKTSQTYAKKYGKKNKP